MRFRKSYLLFAVAVPCFTAWRSYDNERQLIETGRNVAPLASKLKRIFVRPEADVARLDELRRSGGKRGMSPQDRAECWQIVRGLNQEQVKACLADLPESPPQERDEEVRMMLYTRWTQLDPVEVGKRIHEDLVRPDSFPRIYGSLEAMLGEWLKRDPDAALHWAGGEDSRTAAFAGYLAGQRFVRDDPATALEKAGNQAPSVLQGVMAALARNAGDSPATRQQFFELTRDLHGSAEWARAVELVASSWAETSPGEALTSTESYGMSDEEFASFRAAAVETTSWAKPEKALDWMVQNGTEQDFRKISSTYDALVRQDSSQAAEWALKNHRDDLLAASVNGQARQALGWGSDRPDELLQSMAAQYQAWRVLQPEAADQWAGRLPSSFRTKLISSSNDAR